MGGQLAGLLAEEVNRQGQQCLSLDPDPNSPAVQMGAVSVVGDRHNADDIAELAARSDIVTVDLEDVNVDALADLEAKGVKVFPRPATLKKLTNKPTQKETLKAAGLPTSPFIPIDGAGTEGFGELGWPVVQKAATGGYDGRGVVVLKSADTWTNDCRCPASLSSSCRT